MYADDILLYKPIYCPEEIYKTLML